MKVSSLEKKFDEKFNPYEGFRFEVVSKDIKSFIKHEISLAEKKLLMEMPEIKPLKNRPVRDLKEAREKSYEDYQQMKENLYEILSWRNEKMGGKL